MRRFYLVCGQVGRADEARFVEGDPDLEAVRAEAALLVANGSDPLDSVIHALIHALEGGKS